MKRYILSDDQIVSVAAAMAAGYASSVPEFDKEDVVDAFYALVGELQLRRENDEHELKRELEVELQLGSG